MTDLREDLIKFTDNLRKEQEAAFDLWTWLPSFKEAKRYHEDYADTLMPSVEMIMRECAVLCGYLQDRLHGRDRKLPEETDLFQCPCGEAHENPPAMNSTKLFWE